MKERFKEPYSDPRWWWEGKTHPICFECANFEGMVKGKPRCKAFQDGIPRDFFQKSPYCGMDGKSNGCCMYFEQYEGIGTK